MHWKQFNFEKQFSKYYDGVREGVQGPATLLSTELLFAKYSLDLNQINPDYQCTERSSTINIWYSNLSIMLDVGVTP